MTTGSDVTPSISIAIETERKFEFYFVGLIFTLLGLSVQTGNSITELTPSLFELVGRTLLLLSGILAILRLEWLKNRMWAIANMEGWESNRKILEELKSKGVDIVNKDQPIQEHISQSNNEKQNCAANSITLRKMFENNYKLQRLCFLISVSLIGIARSWQQAKIIIAAWHFC